MEENRRKNDLWEGSTPPVSSRMWQTSTIPVQWCKINEETGDYLLPVYLMDKWNYPNSSMLKKENKQPDINVC